MKWLLIENKGLLELESLYLMGASTKRNDENMIGMFGSGNKYAIALLLRYGIPFHIFSGSQKIDITTRPMTLRDTHFDIIQIAGQDTSLTVQMGPQWEPWYAIREIYSNALDEGEARIIETDDLNPSIGHTRFYIEITEEVGQILSNWDVYFSFDRDDMLFENTEYEIKVYPNIELSRKLMVYRMGILVSDSDLKAFFNYDTPIAKIDESRVMRDIYPLREVAAKAWMKCTNQELIEILLINMDTAIRSDRDTSYFEEGLNWGWYDHMMNTESWSAAIADRILISKSRTGLFKEEQQLNSLILPYSLCTAIAKQLPHVAIYGIEEGNAINYVEMEQTRKMSFKLERVLEDLKTLHFEITHPVKVVKFPSASKLGMAQKGTILLSSEVLESSSLRDIALVLIEEELHINKGFEDCSRNMQNYLFEQWINERENLYGKYIL